MATKTVSESEELLRVQNCLKELSIKPVIISRSRYKTIAKNTCRLLPECVDVVCPKSQVEQYRANVSNGLIPIPDSVLGLGNVRNWCVQNFQENIVVMFDDDIKSVYRLDAPESIRVKDKYDVLRIVANTAIMADDAGAKFFGFNQKDIRAYDPFEPFKLASWFGTVVGVIGKERLFSSSAFKVDIDFFLQGLMFDRICWNDTRYRFYNVLEGNSGGSSEFRSSEALDRSFNALKRKWGKYISLSKRKNVIGVIPCVRRKSSSVFIE